MAAEESEIAKTPSGKKILDFKRIKMSFNIVCLACGGLQIDDENEDCKHCQERLRKQTRDCKCVVLPKSVQKVLDSGRVGRCFF